MIFREAAEKAANGEAAKAVEILRTMKSDEMREWFDNHGQMSGLHRSRKLRLPLPVVPLEERDPVRSTARCDRLVFKRDSYTCRYCGLRLLAKEALVAFERAVRIPDFVTKGTNAQQHGVIHAFKIVADHVLPHRCGGRTNLDNLVSACPACNYGKDRYTVQQLGIDDPRDRPPHLTDWDGLTSLISPLKNYGSDGYFVRR